MHQTQHLHNYGFPFYGICGKIQSNFSLCLPLASHRQLLKFFSYKFTFLLQSISFCPFHLIHIYRPFECFARSFPIMANGKFHRIGKNMCKNESFRHAVLLSSRFLSLSYFLWMSQATRQIVIRTNNHPRTKKKFLQVCKFAQARIGRQFVLTGKGQSWFSTDFPFSFGEIHLLVGPLNGEFFVLKTRRSRLRGK